MSYPFKRQLDSFDCGPTCLQMIAEFFGRTYELDYLRQECFLTREGVSLLGISQAAEKIGFRTLMAKVTVESLRDECPLPAILHWNQEHFVVLYKVRRKLQYNLVDKDNFQYIIADPGHGMTKLKEADFLKCWQTSETNQGVVLLLEPTSKFYGFEREKNTEKHNDLKFLFSYLSPFKKQVAILGLLLSLSIAITVALPYVTKSLIDKGVIAKNYSLIVLFVISQLLLYAVSSMLDVFRSWLLLHMNAKISLQIISDFLKKLLRLPIRFFDSKSVGDVSQRINDHHRIENFLTTDILTTVFSILQIVVFSCILFSYRITIWAGFMALSILGVLWIFLFQKKRKQLDYIRFNQNKTSQEKLFELIVGMQEIKLYGSETAKRWEWEHLQVKQYKLNVQSLKLEQYQLTGFIFITQLKNVTISFLTAVAVVNNEISLGVMLSISFIMGQTNGPLQQLIQFVKSAQDAKLSFSRLQEVHQKNDEEINADDSIDAKNNINENIYLNDLSFQYQGPRSPFVLNGINLIIPQGKITAIVGASGSGKTTLMKILLGFYLPTHGQVKIGNYSLSGFSPKWWRSQCGTVMQDGYIFNDSIENNIVLNGEPLDREKFEKSIRVSNIDEFVKELPLRYKTKIGAGGIGLSGGQKQRILIARAVYKNSNYLFFDEATSSLDANNETAIMNSLDNFFIGKTVVVIAHRLSTVRHADQIIVLEKGKIVEMGNHSILTNNRGKYFELVKNQLELGN